MSSLRAQLQSSLNSAVAKASTAAHGAYGYVAPSITKAVSTVSERLLGRQELAAAVRQLEKLAKEARGPLRVAVLRRCAPTCATPARAGGWSRTAP